MPGIPRIVELNGWDAILTTFEALPDGLLFRGQRVADWNLETSLERHVPAGFGRVLAEEKLLKEFRRRAHMYLPLHHLPSDDVDTEWLALMQHFGAPTRLLDFTASPYVATYFAVEDASDGNACAVWAVNRNKLLEAAGDLLLGLDPRQRGRVERAIKAHGAMTIQAGLWRGLEELVAVDTWSKRKLTLVLPFEPERLTERLSIQQGQFLVPRNIEVSFMENLEPLGGADRWLTKFVISASARGRILERLRLMNITRAQLFPGLDGFAQSFRQLLVEEPISEKALRYALQDLQHESTPKAGDTDGAAAERA